MKNSVKLVGIICKEVIVDASVSPDRTDFLLRVYHKGNFAYVPCYSKGKNPLNLKKGDAVKVNGCIMSRLVPTSLLKGKYVMEIYARKVVVIPESEV